MNIRAVKATLLCLLFSGHGAAMAAKLESLAIKNQSGVTSILCAVNGPIAQKVFVLTKPDRVVIDFGQTTTTFNMRTLHFKQDLIQHVRSGQPNAHTLRLVFDVKSHVSIRTSAWQPPGKHQHGLQIDIQSSGMAASVKTTAKPSLAATNNVVNTSFSQRPVHVSHAPSRSMRDVVVVLDPGHGGKDPGAIGPRHTTEKQIVLAIALKLKQQIDRQPGMRAVLTRKGDYYVGLRERMTIARKNNADIFVAIHADAFGNHNSNGASVFALSQTGATSEAARWIAEKENYSELGGVNLSDLDDRNGVIRTVLIDLSQTATIGASLQMGSRVLRRLDKMTTLHNNHVEQARFMVLKSPDIPSVLIETGFISNPREERNLSSSAYQSRMTLAIFEGLKGYFWDYPPHGTRIEAMANVNRHMARSGGGRAPWA